MVVWHSSNVSVSGVPCGGVSAYILSTRVAGYGQFGLILTIAVQASDRVSAVEAEVSAFALCPAARKEVP